jgi:hypothetical protein
MRIGPTIEFGYNAMNEGIGDECGDGDGVDIEAYLSQAFFFSPFNGAMVVMKI